tara:strand:- start:152 stop:553 length:402 start_codon:yes stop_codon:yes gene_type:complete
MSKTQTYQIHLAKSEHGQVMLKEGAAPPKPQAKRVPARTARLLALAYRIDGLVRDGKMTDYAEVALVAGLTRARISQITDLMFLAPTIQERVLRETKPECGRERFGERHLREIIRDHDWDRQIKAFEKLLNVN